MRNIQSVQTIKITEFNREGTILAQVCTISISVLLRLDLHKVAFPRKSVFFFLHLSVSHLAFASLCPKTQALTKPENQFPNGSKSPAPVRFSAVAKASVTCFRTRTANGKTVLEKPRWCTRLMPSTSKKTCLSVKIYTAARRGHGAQTWIGLFQFYEQVRSTPHP